MINGEVARAFDDGPDVEDIVTKVNPHAFPRGAKSTPLYAVDLDLEIWGAALPTSFEKDDSGYRCSRQHHKGQLERVALMITSWSVWRDRTRSPGGNAAGRASEERRRFSHRQRAEL